MGTTVGILGASILQVNYMTYMICICLIIFMKSVEKSAPPYLNGYIAPRPDSGISGIDLYSRIKDFRAYPQPALTL